MGKISKGIMVVLVMASMMHLLVVSQDESPPPISGPPSPPKGSGLIKKLFCDAKCSVKCLRFVRQKFRMAFCMGKCLIVCLSSHADDVVYDCTENCAYPFIANINIHSDMESKEYEEQVRDTVSSCYGSCNKIYPHSLSELD